MLTLGFWQLDRAKQKRQNQQIIEARLSAKPLAFEELPQSPSEPLNFQRVSLYGNYLSEQSIFLVDKFYARQRGYEVLTPFKLKSTNQIVLVSRGWTALGPDPEKLPELDAPNEELHLSGAIHIPAGRSFFIDQPIQNEGWPLRLNHLSMDHIGRLFAVPVFPYVVHLDEAMPGLLHHYPPAVDMHAERSTSYAIQWFAMAILVLLGTLFGCTNIAEIIRPKGR
ncbi:MAG: SURF1 family protein [Methylococcaceae bacterium]|nr:SURF1 family protein [Methylococcaceae bacterium]